jgi:hypothetical protein
MSCCVCPHYCPYYYLRTLRATPQQSITHARPPLLWHSSSTILRRAPRAHPQIPPAHLQIPPARIAQMRAMRRPQQSCNRCVLQQMRAMRRAVHVKAVARPRLFHAAPLLQQSCSRAATEPHPPAATPPVSRLLRAPRPQQSCNRAATELQQSCNMSAPRPQKARVSARFCGKLSRMPRSFRHSLSLSLSRNPCWALLDLS